MSTAPLIPVLLAGCALAGAADRAGHLDLRARIGGAAVLDEVAGNGFAGEPGLSTSAAVMWCQPLGADRRWGFCLGGGTFWDSHRGERAGVDGEYEVRGVEGTVGVLHVIDARWHGELRALARYGQGRIDAQTNGDVVVAGNGDRDDYSAFGLVAGGFYTFPFKLQIGAEVGFMDWQGDSGVGGATAEAEGDGLTVVGTVGYRF